MNIVVTPLHSRPEMFKVWTELVLKCTDIDDLLFLFCLDWGYDEKYEDLIENFPLEKSVIRMPYSDLKLGKQSQNVLNGMVAAAMHSSDLVYYLEEDIFPAVDFFNWHFDIHKQQPDIFCSIATKGNNNTYTVDHDINHYYLTSRPDYQSWGSCFKKQVILDYIYPHFNDAYLNDPNAYCFGNWPQSIVGRAFTEQDGLIRRILETSGKAVAYPCYPLAYHAGFYGYNRQPNVMSKSYDEKLKLIREVCFDADLMDRYSVYKDSVPIDLTREYSVLSLIKVDCLTK